MSHLQHGCIDGHSAGIAGRVGTAIHAVRSVVEREGRKWTRKKQQLLYSTATTPNLRAKPLVVLMES